jgi:REP element-mobilizing transposase RayT
MAKRNEHEKRGEHIGSPLQTIIQWFKTMTTNEYIRNVGSNNWMHFDKRLWQRNYYEHIIRNDAEYDRISGYIKANPRNWKNDQLFTEEQ